MNIYAIQTQTGFENKVIKDMPFTAHFPMRKTVLRKQGKNNYADAPVFTGYVFIEAEHQDLMNEQYAIRKIDGFSKFLNSNQDIRPLSKRDTELVNHLIRNKGISKVRYNEENRIVAIEGPLVGLEGRIVKVDRRKGRAKVLLDLYENSFYVDLAFEVIALA